MIKVLSFFVVLNKQQKIGQDYDFFIKKQQYINADYLATSSYSYLLHFITNFLIKEVFENSPLLRKNDDSMFIWL